MKRIAVYTAVIPSDFDNFKEFPKQDVEVDFFRFTDDYELQNSVRHLVPRMRAKFFKLLPHKLPELKEYDYTIWIDGSANILSPAFARRMIELLGDEDMMVFKHPEDRDCIYQEAEYCKDMPKYSSLPILDQVNYYRIMGYPIHNGLYACGMIVRRNNVKTVEDLDESWWLQNITWTYQDQLSLPYVEWQYEYQVKIKALELDQFNNGLITFERLHKHLY